MQHVDRTGNTFQSTGSLNLGFSPGNTTIGMLLGSRAAACQMQNDPLFSLGLCL